MTLSDLSIKRPVFTTMTSLLLVVLGLLGVSRLGDLVCRGCDRRQPLGDEPISHHELVEIYRAFAAAHRGCPEPAPRQVPPAAADD